METNTITQTHRVQGKSCEVTAHKTWKPWKAFGDYKSQTVRGHGAKTPEQAFKHWKNRAELIADSV
jgi:hypothetical protein